MSVFSTQNNCFQVTSIGWLVTIGESIESQNIGWNSLIYGMSIRWSFREKNGRYVRKHAGTIEARPLWAQDLSPKKNLFALSEDVQRVL